METLGPRALETTWSRSRSFFVRKCSASLEGDTVLLRVLGDEEERGLEEDLLDVALAVARRVRLVHGLRDERAGAVERQAQHIAELGELLAMREERLVLEAVSARV